MIELVKQSGMKRRSALVSGEGGVVRGARISQQMDFYAFRVYFAIVTVLRSVVLGMLRGWYED